MDKRIGTALDQPPEHNLIVPEPQKWSIKEYILYKLDRTIAVGGLIIIGIWALYRGTPETVQIGMAVVGGLVGYIGGRSGKS